MVKIPSNFFIVQFIFVSRMLLSYHNKLINVLCIANAIIKFYNYYQYIAAAGLVSMISESHACMNYTPLV